jgi:hypothetical protein
MSDNLEHHKGRPARSGEHPAVKVYKDKLKSIEEDGGAAVSSIDEELQKFLNDLKTPVPPKLETPDD